MAKIGKVFHILGSCEIYRKFSVLILCICYAHLLVSCNWVENVQHTPIIPEIGSVEKQINPTVTELSDNYQTRDLDDMRMEFIPQDIFQMGSTEAEIESAIDKDLVLRFVPSDRLQVSGTAPNFVAVPMRNPPILDGTISSDEWEGAAFDTFADGNEIRLMQAGNFMYLGLRAKESGTIAGNIFIQQEGQIKIFHSSAALGTAKYLEVDHFWQKEQDFSWRCRSTGDNQSAQDERADFLLEEGWLAANGRMGTPNELEYQIEIPDGKFRMAVVIIKAYPPYDKIAWPDLLEDDCIQPSQGGLPEEMQFSPVDWIIFELIDPDLVQTTEPTSIP